MMKIKSEKECKYVLKTLYERVKTGEMSPERQNRMVEFFETENPHYSESIIDDQLTRLSTMCKDGKISKEDYEKQKNAWESRRERYADNVKEAELKKKKDAEAARKRQEEEDKKPLNRIRKSFSDRMGTKISHPVTESFLDFWN